MKRKIRYGSLVTICFLLVSIFSMLIVDKTYTGLSKQQKKELINEIEGLSTKNKTENNKALESAILVQEAIRKVAINSNSAVVNIRSKQELKVNQFEYSPLFKFFEFFGEDFFPDKKFRFKQPSPSENNPVYRGSGFVISSKGYILTNNHVIGAAKEITVVIDNGKEYKATLVGRDPDIDIAVIKLEDSYPKLQVIPLGNSDEVQIGDFAIAIGNPFGFLKGSLTLGIISAKGRNQLPSEESYKTELKNYIQTDAPINKGNSGGPLLNIKGEVIGINTAIIAPSGTFIGIGFAIPINVVRNAVKSIIEKGYVPRGFLGVGLQNLDKDLSKFFKRETGVIISTIHPKSPADKIGLKPGDLIIKANNKMVKNISQLTALIMLSEPETTVKIEVLRGKNLKKITLYPRIQAKKDKRSSTTPKTTPKEKLSFKGLSITLSPKGESGIYVVNVDKKSPFYKKVNRGDLITSINYSPINSIKDFKDLIEANKNKSILLQVRGKRQGRTVFYHVVINL